MVGLGSRNLLSGEVEWERARMRYEESKRVRREREREEGPFYTFQIRRVWWCDDDAAACDEMTVRWVW